MIDHERIEAYAKRLRWEVFLHHIVLVNVAVEVHDQLAQRKPEYWGTMVLNEQLIAHLEKQFIEHLSLSR